MALSTIAYLTIIKNIFRFIMQSSSPHHLDQANDSGCIAISSNGEAL
jgi:hypothetical protein